MLADLWNSPDAANTLGCSTTGSSEAAMLGGMAMKWRWRDRQKQAGRPTDRPNLVIHRVPADNRLAVGRLRHGVIVGEIGFIPPLIRVHIKETGSVL